jgi:hypothetical protein
VRNPGIAVDHSKIGFWCIGSGATAAQMSLFFRNYTFTLSPEEAAYYVLEAKISAQPANGVGEKTHVFLVKKGMSTPIELQSGTLIEMRHLYDRLKPQPFDAQQELAKCDEFRMLAQAP